MDTKTPATVDAPGSFWDGAEIIHTYSRADAIRDGALVDMSATASTEFGVLWPIAFTASAFDDVVAWNRPGQRTDSMCQDETGRLADVIVNLRLALPGACSIAQQKGSARVGFKVMRVPAHGRGHLPRLTDLVLVLGPGDDGKASITIMLPDED